MLTTTELAAHLQHLTYRPGWTIHIYDGAHEGQHLVITTQVEDTTKPGTTTTLDIHSMLPPMRDTEQFETWLLWRLKRIEVHECREWFKRDGTPVSDPHAPYADRDLD